MSGELVAKQFADLAWQLSRLDERLTDDVIVDIWIEALAHAGIGAKRAKMKAAGEKWAVDQRYVLEFACPEGHRTKDARSSADVRIIIYGDGWFEMDLESPCPMCSEQSITEWFITCAACATGKYLGEEDEDWHYAGHLFGEGHGHELDGDVGTWSGKPIGNTSVLACLLCVLDRRERIALAHWYVDHTAEAFDESERDAIPNWDEYVSGVVDRHRKGLIALTVPQAALVKVKAKANKRAWNLDQTVDLLDQCEVPNGASQAEAWAVVGSLPDHPIKRLVEQAQNQRKLRDTSP